MQPPQQLKPPIEVSAIEDGLWVEPSKYFNKPVGWADIPPVTYTPAPLPLQRGKQKRFEVRLQGDELTEIFDIRDPSHIFSQLPPEIIEKIERDKSESDIKKIRDTNALCMQFASTTENIAEFNPILDEFLTKMKRNELDLDYIPFARSGCTSFIVAFVEHRCNQMAKRTYNLLIEPFDETKVEHLRDLRHMMMMDFAIPKRKKNDDELRNILLKKNDEAFIDNINCSIERVAKLCCTVIDTDVAPRGDLTDNIALQLLTACCDQFLTIINTRGLRQDLKIKTIDRLKRMMSWLFAIANDGAEDQLESYIKQYYRDMRSKIIKSVQQPPAGGPAGGAKSKNKSNKKRNSNKNKNSRRKNKKNKKKTLRLRIKK